MDTIYGIFAYLKKVPKRCIAFDPSNPSVDMDGFNTETDWHDFYEDAVELFPPNMPAPRGNHISMDLFVDAEHAGNKVTRRSHTGFFIFLQNAPIIWFTKRQNTVESSSFGSEFVAMRIAVEHVKALQYKLRMFGVKIVDPARVHCDNQGFVKNTSLPASNLSRKHNAVNYHTVREAAASKIIVVGKEDTETNLADMLTKVLGRICREFLIPFTGMYPCLVRKVEAGEEDVNG